jgi:hypothetical protein
MFIAKFDAITTKFEAHVRINVQLQRGDINVLEASSKTFTTMKNRRLAVYKRDHHPEKMTSSDRADIAAGNQEARGAGPMAEAKLYEAGGRPDFWLYKDIYVLPAQDWISSMGFLVHGINISAVRTCHLLWVMISLICGETTIFRSCKGLARGLQHVDIALELYVNPDLCFELDSNSIEFANKHGAVSIWLGM